MTYDDLKDNELENLEFEEIIEESSTGSEWRPEEAGEYIIGRYITTEEGKGKGEGYLFHYIRDTNSEERSIFGCTTLNSKLKTIDPGDIIKIVYNGIKTSERGRNYKDFTILKPKIESE